MTKLNNYAHKIYEYGTYLISSAAVFSLFSFPTIPSIQQPIPILVGNVNPGTVISAVEDNTPLKDAFFGSEASTGTTHATIQKQVAFVSSRKAFPASLEVIKKHEDTIRTKARQNGVPEDVAIGVGLLENGGSETAKSSAGALGVFQLMPGTARSLGLTVNKKVDERRIPEKNIEAGMNYLAQNYERFGDWGLATWAYHAGEGNVSKALKLYAKENHGLDLKGLKETSAMKKYIEKYDITIHKLLSSKAVKSLTKKLNDDSAGYPYKVIATAELFREAQ